MNFIPKVRPKAVKSVYKERSVPQFRRWIKRLECSVKGCPRLDIDPSHIRHGLPAGAAKGGTGLKPHDTWIIPLCRGHHDELGGGEPSFYKRYAIDAVPLSQELWAVWLRTDAGKKYSLGLQGK